MSEMRKGAKNGSLTDSTRDLCARQSDAMRPPVQYSPGASRPLSLSQWLFPFAPRSAFSAVFFLRKHTSTFDGDVIQPRAFSQSILLWAMRDRGRRDDIDSSLSRVALKCPHSRRLHALRLFGSFSTLV